MKREEMAMEKVFEAINGVFSFIGPLSDFLWEFPTILTGTAVSRFWEIYPLRSYYFLGPGFFLVSGSVLCR